MDIRILFQNSDMCDHTHEFSHPCIYQNRDKKGQDGVKVPVP